MFSRHPRPSGTAIPISTRVNQLFGLDIAARRPKKRPAEPASTPPDSGSRSLGSANLSTRPPFPQCFGHLPPPPVHVPLPHPPAQFGLCQNWALPTGSQPQPATQYRFSVGFGRSIWNNVICRTRDGAHSMQPFVHIPGTPSDKFPHRTRRVTRKTRPVLYSSFFSSFSACFLSQQGKSLPHLLDFWHSVECP